MVLLSSCLKAGWSSRALFKSNPFKNNLTVYSFKLFASKALNFKDFCLKIVKMVKMLFHPFLADTY